MTEAMSEAITEVQVPELSESVSSGTLLAWRKAVGDTVVRDEILVDLETDKVVLEISAPAAGVLSEILVPEGGVVQVGQVIAHLGTAGKAGEVASKAVSLGMSPPVIEKTTIPAETGGSSARNERRVPMTRLRLRIAERLKEAQNTAAMLTTFNEVNMQPVQQVRQRYKDSFQQEHGVKLGLMSFFVKAICHALKQYPVINARVDGRDILYHDYCDIGVAVSSERGLVVPVLRDAETLGLADVERRIGDFARRANALKLQIEELEGGTFTITNGGIFGSLMSTPILNPPQSAVLGLHKIQDRPIAENGQVVIRPMMYLALSYDHRIIDGREAVSFLASVKESIEDPARLLLEL